MVDSVSGRVRAGRVVALVGPNGSGKSTLLRLMLGQLVPGAGRVMLGGQAMGRVPWGRRAAVMSYVPQRSSAVFPFTVREVVAMGRHAVGVDEAAVERAMAACGLVELGGEVMSELSVGQQQRVLVARAMAQAAGRGRVMLLDEPTSAMDLAHVHATMGMLCERAEAGLAVVTVVQDLNLAGRYAEEVWLMRGGRIVAAGAAGEVLNPATLGEVYGVMLRRIDAGDGRVILDAG